MIFPLPIFINGGGEVPLLIVVAVIAIGLAPFAVLLWERFR
jgi:hypothetical protein